MGAGTALGAIDNPIDQDENGTPVGQEPLIQVWTGTANNGTVSSTKTCGNWTTSADAGRGIRSLVRAVTEWTAHRQAQSCSILRNLYCFEQ